MDQDKRSWRGRVWQSVQRCQSWQRANYSHQRDCRNEQFDGPGLRTQSIGTRRIYSKGHWSRADTIAAPKFGKILGHRIRRQRIVYIHRVSAIALGLELILMNWSDTYLVPFNMSSIKRKSSKSPCSRSMPSRSWWHSTICMAPDSLATVSVFKHSINLVLTLSSDLKLSNLLLDNFGNIKISDYIAIRRISGTLTH